MTDDIRRAYERERAAAWQAYIDRVMLSDEAMRGEALTAFEAGYDAATRSFEPYADAPQAQPLMDENAPQVEIGERGFPPLT
jgi:hypothetical protein